MNKLGKKFSAGIVVFALSFAMMVGCSNNANKPAQTPGAAQQTPSATQAPNNTQTPTPAPNSAKDTTAGPQPALPNQSPAPKLNNYNTTVPKDVSKVTPANFDKVNIDMNFDEVVAIMGAPEDMKEVKDSNENLVKYCIWKSKEGKEFTISFSERLVIGKTGTK